MKTRLIRVCFFALAVVLFSGLPLAALAQTKISLSVPGSYQVTTSTPPGYIISNFYQFALLIGGLLAFGAVVYGGVRYVTSGGNPSSQSEAKEWIWSALLGLLLLVCAYLVLATINPNLVHLDLPTLSQVNISGPSGGGGGGGGGGLGNPNGGVSDPLATQELNNASICLKTGQGAASASGMQQGTINDLQNLAADSGENSGSGSCNIVITSGVDGDHSGGQCSHANGYKADLRPNPTLDKYITSLPYIGTRSDGARMYAYGGGSIADERNLPGVGAHWDLSAACP